MVAEEENKNKKGRQQMKNLVTALVKAQAEFKPIKKESENPFYHSKYAELDAVIEATKEALIANGLAIVQTFGTIADGRTILATTLYHISGESLCGHQPLDVKDPTDIQKMMSASSYARRYGWMAILGLSATDDDGNVASGVKDAPTATKPVEPELPLAVTLCGELLEVKVRDIVSKKTGKPYKVADYVISNDKGETFETISSFDIKDCVEGDQLKFLGIKESEFKDKKQLTASKVEKLTKEQIEFPF